MGRSVALRAVRMGHFANGQPLRISVIDRYAECQRENLLYHYPVLKSGGICQLDFHPAEAESFTARKLIEQWAGEPDTLVHVFLCLDENSRATEVALHLQEALLGRQNLNLLVRIKSRTSLQSIVEMAADRSPRLAAFGRVEDACCDNAFRHEHNEAIARAMHEQFVANREVDSIRKPGSEPTLVKWENLGEDIRESNRQQADHIPIKLRAIGCELAPLNDPRKGVVEFTERETELLAELEHRRWNAERCLAGWRYGTPSNKQNRINENLVPWNELHASIQKYDRESVMSIPARLKLAEPPMKVVRVS